MKSTDTKISRNRNKPPPINAKPVRKEEFEGLETELCGVKMRTPFAVGEMFGFGGEAWKMNAEEQAAEYLRWVEAGVGWLAITNIQGVSSQNIRQTILEKSRKITDRESTPRWVNEGLPKPSYPNFLYSWQAPGGFSGVTMMGHGRPIGIGGGASGTAVWPTSMEERKKKKEKLQRIIDIVKSKKPANVPLVFTISGLGAVPEDFVESAKLAEELGADLIDLNNTCPVSCFNEDYPKWCEERSWPAHNMAGAHMAMSTPGVGDLIAKAVVDSVHIPIGVKFSPEICTFPLIVETAKMYERVGVKFITTMNSGCAVVPPDIYNHGKPVIEGWDRNSITGIQGPYALPHQYLAIAALRHYVPDMEVLAVGGIMNPENVVECLMLGARTTAQVTAVLTRGLDVMRQNVHFLHKFLKDQGYKDIKEFIGIHEQYFGGQEFIAGRENVVYIGATDYNKCVGCGVCCDLPGMASLCRHMDLESGCAVVDERHCNSCGSCVIACPYDACYMRKVESRF
jgi:Na+-translocating ferredoxin:NAD+ oxidoreductase RNF subunit RnfB